MVIGKNPPALHFFAAANFGRMAAATYEDDRGSETTSKFTVRKPTPILMQRSNSLPPAIQKPE